MHIEMLTMVLSGCGIIGEFSFLLNAYIGQGLIKGAEWQSNDSVIKSKAFYRDLTFMQLWELVK